MFCIVGLGNIGKEYEKTRHNIGFMVADEIIRHYTSGKSVQKYHSIYHTGQIAGHKIHILKPLTFMNRSGIAVAELCSFFKIPPENVIVIHDDLDLAPFEIRLKQGGGAGGHNGLKSLDAHIGKNYHRIRIGIGRPADKELVTPWVLGDFSKQDMLSLPEFCDNIAQTLPLFFEKNPNDFKMKLSVKK